MPERKEHNEDDNRQVKKFMFDLRRFDEPEEEPEDLPPTFSEEELAQARKEGHEAGYAEGKAEGHRLAVESREQHLANTLRTISESFTMLFVSETDREKEYEEESVYLTQQVLKKLFPVLNSQYGTEEIQAVIMNVLKNSSHKSLITIEVSPDDEPGIQELLESYWSDPETAPRYRVLANPELKAGQCQLAWEDGGAVRDAEALAEEISGALTGLLGISTASAPVNAPENVPAGQNNAINEEDSGESTASSLDPETSRPEEDHE